MIPYEKTKKPLLAWAYYAETAYINDNLKPYRWYKTQTLLGAKEHGLPPRYIEEKIENVKEIPCECTKWHCFHDKESWNS